MQTYQEKMKFLVESQGEVTLQAIHAVEKAFFAATDRYAEHDAEHQEDCLGLLRNFDEEFLPTFFERSIMQSAYQTLEKASPEVFWSKGYPKLKATRERLWNELLAPVS